jgi:hypothetical protein
MTYLRMLAARPPTHPMPTNYEVGHDQQKNISNFWSNCEMEVRKRMMKDLFGGHEGVA